MVSTAAPSISMIMMSSGVSAPLSRPEIVIAACAASRRIEKLLLVAGVRPCAPSLRPAAAIAWAQAASWLGV